MHIYMARKVVNSFLPSFCLNHATYAHSSPGSCFITGITENVGTLFGPVWKPLSPPQIKVKGPVFVTRKKAKLCFSEPAQALFPGCTMRRWKQFAVHLHWDVENGFFAASLLNMLNLRNSLQNLAVLKLTLLFACCHKGFVVLSRLGCQRCYKSRLSKLTIVHIVHLIDMLEAPTTSCTKFGRFCSEVRFAICLLILKYLKGIDRYR